MNTLYKKIVTIIVVMNSSIVIAKNNDINISSKDKYICLQFAPTESAPFSQDKDDQYFAGLLTRIIKIDEEIQNNPRLKPSQSIADFIAGNKDDHTIISKKTSFGWNDPLAIISAMFTNGFAETPNEFTVLIKKSHEYPGKHKAIIQGKGLYADKKSAQSELTDYFKNGPAYTSKFQRLEDITNFNNLFTSKNENFKRSEKDKLIAQTPSLQGEVKCDCYLHGCDVTGVIYFNKEAVEYLIQQENGNRHKKNTVKRTQPIMAASKPVQIQEVATPKSQIEFVSAIPTKATLDQKISQASSDTLSSEEKDLLVAMAEKEADNADVETDEKSELKDDKK